MSDKNPFDQTDPRHIIHEQLLQKRRTVTAFANDVENYTKKYNDALKAYDVYLHFYDQIKDIQPKQV